MSSTTRYYYTDPLAAAWMAKHFGMGFTVRKHGELADVIGIMFVLPEEIAKGSYSRYSIHPDSLRLLEPQDGDLVKSRCSAFECGVVLDNSKAQLSSDSYIVIQRDGKPFHWPESEAA